MIAIIAAMDKELTTLREAMTLTETVSIAHKTFWVGRIGPTAVVIAQSGIGKVNAAVTAALLLDRYPVDCLINTGLAGGVAPTQTGDIVLSTGVAYSDVDLRAVNPELPFGQIEGEPLRLETDPVLAAEMEAILREERVAYRKGTIVSGDQFITSAAALEPIRANIPDVIACEMEGMAIALTAWHFHVPCIILRGISDVIDAPAQIQNYFAIATAIAAKTTRLLVRFLRDRI